MDQRQKTIIVTRVELILKLSLYIVIHDNADKDSADKDSADKDNADKDHTALQCGLYLFILRGF